MLGEENRRLLQANLIGVFFWQLYPPAFLLREDKHPHNPAAGSCVDCHVRAVLHLSGHGGGLLLGWGIAK